MIYIRHKLQVCCQATPHVNNYSNDNKGGLLVGVCSKETNWKRQYNKKEK